MMFMKARTRRQRNIRSVVLRSRDNPPRFCTHWHSMLRNWGPDTLGDPNVLDRERESVVTWASGALDDLFLLLTTCTDQTGAPSPRCFNSYPLPGACSENFTVAASVTIFGHRQSLAHTKITNYFSAVLSPFVPIPAPHSIADKIVLPLLGRQDNFIEPTIFRSGAAARPLPFPRSFGLPLRLVSRQSRASGWSSVCSAPSVRRDVSVLLKA